MSDAPRPSAGHPSEPRAEQVRGVPPAPHEIDITDAATGGLPRSARPYPDSHAGDRQDESGLPADRTEIEDYDSLDAQDSGDADDSGPGVPDAGDLRSDPDSHDEPDDAGDAAPPLRKVVESILLVVDQPVPEVDLAQVLEAPRATVLSVLEDLAAEYLREQRGFELRQVAGGWRLYTAPDCAPYIERFVLDGQQARLTQAALETLAVIAYRQPVSRQSIAAIRGVNVDGVVRTLLARGLVSEAGEEGPGGAHLYVTTPYFLERLGLRSLDELPNLAPLLPANLDDLAEHG
jgi:segregation and condensation protein B